MAAKIGFKPSTGGLEVLNSDEPTTSTATASPPHRQGATPGAQKSEAGHSGLAAVPSNTAPGQPVAAACVTTAAAGLPGIAEGALRASAAQPGAPAGALPSAPSQPGASAGAQAAGVGQPGAAAVKPASAGTLPGAFPASAAGQTGAAAGFPTVPAGQTGAAAGDPTSSMGQTGVATGFPTGAAGPAGPAAGVPTSSAGHATAAAGVPAAAAGLGGASADVPAPAAYPPGGSAGVPTAASGQPPAGLGVPTAAASQPGAARVAPTPSHALPDATAWDPVSYAPGSTAWAPGVEARAQAATGRPISAAAVQPRNDAWDLVGPHTELTMFHRGVQVQGAQGSEAAADTGRAPAVQMGSSAWSSGEQFFAPSAFPPGAHMQGACAPSAVGFAQHAGAVQPVTPASTAPSWPIGHALQPPNAVYLVSGQPHAFVQLPLLTHRPPLHHDATLLASDEVLDNASCQPARTSASRGLGLSSMLSGFMQVSHQVLPSSAASSSMVPSTQGGENGEVPGKKGWTGVTKKLDKDEWIGRIVLDRASQSLIIINSHFGTEEEAARSIATTSHVMFIDKPTRGDLISLTADDKAKLRECSAHQCEVMVRMKFWHMWEEWRKYWPAAKAKWDAKMCREERKRAAIKASLDEDDAWADKMARTKGEVNAGAETAYQQEGSGSKNA
ncbi:unnamed protein product [Closterium sp. Naga37s-1]|nr:unnamed protein product [Closterium sp. Naga37s-1]